MVCPESTEVGSAFLSGGNLLFFPGSCFFLRFFVKNEEKESLDKGANHRWHKFFTGMNGRLKEKNKFG
jgi:hypothetical protein